MRASDIYKPRVSGRQCRHLLRNVDYAVQEWGSKGAPKIFYLHGWGDCASTWQPVVDAFSGEWHVISPDWRGFGATANHASSFWFPDYLADLDALLDVYAEKSVRLVGHSMGGNIGGLYAGTRPDRVGAFVNVEGFGLPDAQPGDAPARYRQWLDALKSPSEFMTYGSYAELAARIRKRNPRMTAPLAAYVARCWAIEEDGKVTLRADPLHRLPNPVLYRRAESEACWRRISAEVLLVVGSESPLASRADSPAFPAAARCTIPGSGHMPHFEAPAELAAAIEDFFAKTL